VGGIEIDCTRILRVIDERQIEVRPVPVGIGDVIVRTGGDQELPGMTVIVCERLAEAMKEKRESALEATADMGVLALPRTPLGKRSNVRQVVAIGELFDEKVGQRSRRFADGEPRVPSTLEQGDGVTPLPQGQCAQGAREAGPDDGEVDVEGGHEAGGDEQCEQQTMGCCC
jgi:hypothetical protein